MDAIVVADRNWAIGRNNELLFHLPEDMRRFRTLTLGGTLIMGRRTLDSFPRGMPLPRRRNIVITRDPAFAREGVEAVHSPAEAADLAAGDGAVWVVGGGSVYAALLERCRRVHLTRVAAEAEGADTWFPNLDDLPAWRLEKMDRPVSDSGYTYRFLTYVRENG